ncbi:hypothetical protein Emed_003441 [Eimeria media]
MTSSLRAFASTLLEFLFLSFVAAACRTLAENISKLGSAGGLTQSVATVAEVEKASDNVRLLHPSAEGASMPCQTRHRVFHRTLLAAATNYVAILSVALLILVCARRLSNLSVEEGRVRSLASAEVNELAGACGGDAAGGGEEENHEEDQAWQEGIVQQAEENMRRAKEMICLLVALKGGHKFKAVTSATSVFMLVLSEMGLLGGFIDEELSSLRQLWLSAMEDAVGSAQALGTAWFATDITLSMKNIHIMNGELAALMSTIRTADKNGKLILEGSRWVALKDLVRVQEVVLNTACAYLSVLDPAREVRVNARHQALGRLAKLAEVRRRMVLVNESFAKYFASFQLQGFARKRFGEPGAQGAREKNPPLSPQDQIDYLREHFSTNIRVRPQEAAAAVSTPSPADTAPTSEGEKAPLPPQVLPMQPLESPMKPAGSPQPPQAPRAPLQGIPMQPVGPAQPPMQPPGSAVQPAGPPSASGLGPQAPYSLEKLGARPKTHSTVAATGGKKSSGTSSKKPSSGVPHVVQLPAGTPQDPRGARLPSTSSLKTHMKKPQGGDPGILDEHSQSSATTTHKGTPPSRGKGPEVKKPGLKDVRPSVKEGALPGPWAEAEGGAAEVPPDVPAGELAQGLAALSVGKEEGLTADDGVEAGEGIDPSDDSTVHPRQTKQVPLPTQGQHPSSSVPWSAPGTPVSPHMPGVRSPFSPHVGTFFGVAQGMPRHMLPTPRPPLPSGFGGPPHPSGPAPHTVQRPPGPPGMSTGVSATSPFVRPRPPPRFAGPQQPGGFVRHILQRPPEPSGPLTSTSGGPVYGPLLGTIRHPFPRAPRPPFPSMPSPSGLIPPSTSQPRVAATPHVSPSMPSGPGPLSSLFGAPKTWSSLCPSAPGLSLSGPHPAPPSQPSLMGPSPSGLSTPALPWHPSTDPSPDQNKPKSRISGAFHGTPMGEPKPSSTSVTTAPPPS